MLDTIRHDGDAVIGSRLMSIERDAWMRDHAIAGTPVLPGVIGVEMMAAAARMCHPGQKIAAARDVRFQSPVKLYGQTETTVELLAQPAPGGQVKVQLSAARTSRAGKLIRSEHFDGHIVLGEVDAPAPIPPAILAGIDLDQGGIYQRFFHGPGFQVLMEAVGVASDGLEVEVRVDHHALSGDGLLTGPLLLEAAFQAAGLHRMIVDSEVALPSRFEQVVWMSVPRDGDELWATVRRREDGAYDVDVDSADEPVLRLRGFEMIARGPLPSGDRIAPPAEGWPAAVIAQASFEAPPRVILPDEEARLTARGTLRRKRDRLAGQAAAKLALSSLTGCGTDRFRVDRDALGAPLVVGLDARVSISHRAGVGWALAARTGHPGIDVELIEARPASFAQTWLTSGERVLSAGQPLLETVIWSVKEAVVKALGTGFRVPAQQVEVTSIGRASVALRLGPLAARRHAERGGGEIQVRWARRGAEVIALVLLASNVSRECLDTAA
jgi:4'-phosphopantetheinyl transferase EntD/3-hydroxymyristoyl/3-hydroxydecanoyl-(acyl carrier protein) dehydratase